MYLPRPYFWENHITIQKKENLKKSFNSSISKLAKATISDDLPAREDVVLPPALQDGLGLSEEIPPLPVLGVSPPDALEMVAFSAKDTVLRRLALKDFRSSGQLRIA